MNPLLPPSRAHKTTLSPHDPQRFVDCMTIGYHAGDLPSVIVHVGGDKYELWPGQVLPTGGTQIMIENPYERHGTVQFSLNTPPQPVADVRALSGSRQSHYVTYLKRVQNTKPVSGREMGVLAHLHDGRGRLKFSGGAVHDVLVFSNIPEGALDDIPATIFQSQWGKLQHTSGAEMPRLQLRTGERGTPADWDAWLAAYGSSWGAGVPMSVDASGNFEVDAVGPVLIAGYRWMDETSLTEKTLVTFEDYGVTEGAAYA